MWLRGKRYLFAMLGLLIHAEFVNWCMQEEADMSAKTLTEKFKAEFNILIATSKMNDNKLQERWKQGTTRYCHLIRNENKIKRKQWCKIQIINAEQFEVLQSSMSSNVLISFFQWKHLCPISILKMYLFMFFSVWFSQMNQKLR